MDILPINQIADEDVSIVGVGLANLAKLNQFNLPVPDGIVVLPPDFRLRTILKHFDLEHKEVFEQSLEIIKQELIKIPVPEDLAKALNKRKVNIQAIWLDLLDDWLAEIRSRVWRMGLSQGVTLNLSAKPIFFIDKVKASGTAYFDEIEKEVMIHVKTGVLSSIHQTQLNDLVLKANKILFLPQVIHWVIDSKKHLYIIKLTPYTQSVGVPEKSDKVSIQRDLSKPTVSKAGLKIFLDLSKGLTINNDGDGAIICAENISLIGNSENSFDSQVFKLVEVAQTYSDRPVIFKLSDRSGVNGEVRGTLRLLHSNNLLQDELRALLFARKQKGLTNIQLAIPFTRSLHEFEDLKQQMIKLGVRRQGTLKFWLEVAVPENIIHIEEYLNSGLDGVLLNLDELSAWLGGFDYQSQEGSFYKTQVESLLQFLTEALKKLHRHEIPVLAFGNLALHDEVLNFLVERGVYGVAVTLANSYSLHEHLQTVEKRLLRNKVV